MSQTQPTPAVALERMNIESAARRDWLPWLDRARVLAACGVIWIHTPRSNSLTSSVALGRFAVPFFIGAAVLLVVRALQRNPHRDLQAYLGNRTERLIFPFVGWSLIYLAMKLVKKLVTPDQPNEMPGWEALVLGTAYHLWFLPFLWVVSVATFLVTRYGLSRGHASYPAIASLGLGALFALLPYPGETSGGEATYFMWLAIPAACWSYALAIWWPELAKRIDPSLRLQLALSVWAFSTGILWFLERSALVEGLAGLSFLVMALDSRPGRFAEALDRFAPLAFGVYLSHLLILKVGESVLQAANVAVTPWIDLSLFAVVLWLSLGLSYVLQRSRWTRWLLG